ncbi:MAG: S8 family serine peptidase, partial [Acidimicrobiia bacterium]
MGLLRNSKPGRWELDAAGRVTVEIVHTPGAGASVRAGIDQLSGMVLQSAPGVILAKVPSVGLAALERRPGVQYLRSPIRVDLLPDAVFASESLSTEGDIHVVLTNAASWHAAGYRGAGVKIGVIDYFDGGTWSLAEAAGAVPAPAGVFCRDTGISCDIWTGASRHGVAVAEIVHDMAPEAVLYLATAVTTTDLAAAVDWFDSQGVQVVTRSLGSQLDGPGDGTGSVDAVVDDAVNRGMVWFNAAGNHASASGVTAGGYWRGNWVDGDSDGWMEFAPGDEGLGFVCGGVQGFRWSDWGGAGTTDYDILITDSTSGATVATSVGNQVLGAPPLEIPGPIDCSAHPLLTLWVHLFDAGSGTSGDVLEFMVNGTAFEYSSNPYSVSHPAADSANPGAMAVGAIDPPTDGTIAYYSSQGPTNDERIKPDLAAPSCLSTVSYQPDCFNGTSAATPVAAGAAALVWGSGVATTPQTVTQFLRSYSVDRGAPGADLIYGAGELYLGEPPNQAPIVDAGPDQMVILSGAALLDGTVVAGGGGGQTQPGAGG